MAEAKYEQAATSDPEEKKDSQKLSSEETKKEKLTCSQKCANCKEGCAWACYHDGLYCYQSPKNWVKIISGHLIMWTCVALLFWGFLTAAMKDSAATMEGFLIFFIVFIVMIAILIFWGTLTVKKEEVISRDD
jgi:hypothetical protein